MQITASSADGLKRKLTVVVGAAELGQRLAARLGEVKDRVQLKGFRRGKVPEAHIRKVYGKALMSEVLDEAIRDTSLEAIKDRNERAAARPDIALAEGSDIEKVIEGKADLAYEMSFEVLPEIKITDLASLELERLVADVEDDAVEKGLSDLAERVSSFEPEEGRKVSEGDRVTINYEGRIGGEPFEGGKGEGLSLVIGNANFIPGFEDGLKGAVKGERRDVACTFPEAYPKAELAGKDAVFDVTVLEVEKPVKPAIDDAFATSLGVESLEKLREVVANQIKGELDQLARLKLKRELLDKLEKVHDFELPPSLVEREFTGIWQQLKRELERQDKTLGEEGVKSEAELEAEYRAIAARRVRLGLVVGEIGNQHKIEVTQDEMRRALIEQARRHPGQEKFVYEYFEKTPGALQELRAPIFEDKVVDLIIEKAKPVERKVTRDELVKRVEEVTQS